MAILGRVMTHRLSVPTRSLVLAALAATLEIIVILPFVDQEQMARVRQREWFQPAELEEK